MKNKRDASKKVQPKREIKQKPSKVDLKKGAPKLQLPPGSSKPKKKPTK